MKTQGLFVRIARYSLVSAAFLAGYLALDLVAIFFETYRGVTPWYPPAGLSLTLLLAGGPAYAPIVGIAYILSNLLVWHLEFNLGFYVLAGSAITAIYTLTALVLRARFGRHIRLADQQQMIWFLCLSLVAPLFVAALTSMSMAASSLIDWSNITSIAIDWWIGDSVGILTIAPLLIIVVLPWMKSLSSRIHSQIPKRRKALGVKSLLEISLQILSILLALLLAFGSHVIGHDYLSYLSFIPVLWLAMRYGLPGAVTAIVAVNFGSMLLFIWVSSSPSDPSLHQIFMLVLAITGLLIGTIITDRKAREQELQVSENRFRTLVESMQDIVFTLDRRQRHTGVFGPWLQKFGAPPDHFIGKTAEEVLGKEAGTIHQDANRRALSGEFVVYEWSTPVRNETHYYQTSLSPIIDKAGKIAGLVGVGRDITEISHAQEELKERQRFIGMLNDITRAALEQADLEATVQTLADHLTELFQADSCYITEWDEANGHTLPVAATGDQRDSYRQDRSDLDELTLTESVLKAERALVVEDVTCSAYISPKIAAKYPVASLLGLPLIASGQKLGAVLVAFNKFHCFTSREVEQGEQAAKHIALAILKARLFEAGQKRSAQLGRANTLITALGHVAASIIAANDPDGVIEALGTELDQLGIHFLFARLTTDRQHLAIQYISPDNSFLHHLLKYTDQNPEEICVPLHGIPEIAESLGWMRPTLLENPVPVIRNAFPFIPETAMKRGLKTLKIQDSTPTILLPLIAEEQAIGLLVVWGLQIQEQDFSYLTVFASQVAIALEKARLNADLQRLAITDPLTCLFNRRGLYELGQREVERARRYHRPLTAIMLDIDHFKLVNDRFGHPTGDVVLKILAERLQRMVREIDILARYGGEEFVILLPEIDMVDARPVAERLRREIAEHPIPTDDGDISITISIGVTQASSTPTDLECLIERADGMMYLAKKNGRDCVAIDENGDYTENGEDTMKEPSNA
jgi:diguanylate cyclase (GGDEF)-like protein/PAS domain S-box-containing protein